MRGSDLNKAIHELNFYIKKTLLYSNILYNILILVLFYFNERLNMTKYFIGTIPEIIIILFIFKISSPIIRKNDNYEELIHPGTPLSGKGVPALLFDSLVISMVVKILLFYHYAWSLLYFGIIGLAVYELVYKTVQKFKTS